MPHIIIEHSKRISKNHALKFGSKIRDLMGELKEGNFDPEQCKIRQFSFDQYYVGSKDETEADFMHISIKILSGRSLDVRKTLSYQVMAALNTFVVTHSLRLDLSVDIIEMDANTYQKQRIGT